MQSGSGPAQVVFPELLDELLLVDELLLDDDALLDELPLEELLVELLLDDVELLEELVGPAPPMPPVPPAPPLPPMPLLLEWPPVPLVDEPLAPVPWESPTE